MGAALRPRRAPHIRAIDSLSKILGDQGSCRNHYSAEVLIVVISIRDDWMEDEGRKTNARRLSSFAKRLKKLDEELKGCFSYLAGL